MARGLTLDEFVSLLEELLIFYFPHDFLKTFERIFKGQEVGGIIYLKSRDEIIEELTKVLRPIRGSRAEETAEQFYEFVISKLGNSYTEIWDNFHHVLIRLLLKIDKQIRKAEVEELERKGKGQLVSFEKLQDLHYFRIEKLYPGKNEEFIKELAYVVAIFDALYEFGGDVTRFIRKMKEAYSSPDVSDEDEVTAATASGYRITYPEIEGPLPSEEKQTFYDIIAESLYEVGFYPDPDELLSKPYDKDRFLELLRKKFPNGLIDYFIKFVPSKHYDVIFSIIYDKML